MSDTQEKISIKGVKNGILVTIDATEMWLTLTDELAKQIDAKRSFFEGAKISVDLGERPVPKHELMSLVALLERRGLRLWSVMSTSNTTVEAAHTLDLKTNVANTVPKHIERPQLPQLNPEEAGTDGVLVRRTLRSGRTVHSEGHVVIIGDVNPGAQIVAKGDVVIWGRLRGTVHAGSDGDESAVVCALDMYPTQLRIAGFIVTSPDDPGRQPQPEVARIRNNQIVVESWR